MISTVSPHHIVFEVMSIVEYYGRERNAWVDSNKWDGVTVTTLWSEIWAYMDPYLRTATQIKNGSETSVTYQKSRRGEVAFRTVYNKMQQANLFKGNKPRKKSIEANIDAQKMLAEKKAADVERARQRREEAV